MPITATAALKGQPSWSLRHSRSRLLLLAIAAGLATGLLESHRAWIGPRLYPTTPVSRLLGPLPRALNVALYSTLLTALAAAAIAGRPRRWLGAAVAVCAIFVCFDQSRLQPWLYQYVFMLAAFAVYAPRTDDPSGEAAAALNVCRLVVVCIYVWSGLQKLNSEFIQQAFPSLIEPLTRFLPTALASALNSLGLLAPLGEIAIGEGLLTRRLRPYAVAGALVMHALLLYCLGPLGWDYNSIVWPWNLTMAASVLVLFWNEPNVTSLEIVWPARRRFHGLVLILFGIAPVLSFANFWDQYLSFGLYARPRNELTLYVNATLAYRLPNDVLRYVHPADRPGLYTIDVDQWSLSELNLTIYPEPRVYKAVGRFVCSFARRPSEMRVVIQQSGVLFSPDREIAYDCGGLPN